MRNVVAIISSGLLAFSTPAFAGPSAEVNAEEFYSTARQLEGKGALALFDGRMKTMKKQIRDAGLSARAANKKALKNGGGLYCASEAQRKKGLGVEQVLDMLGALGKPTRSRMTLEAAWLEALKRTYPCS